MAGLLGGAFSTLLFITVALTAVGIGLVTSSAALRAAFRSKAFGTVVIANVVVVPLIGYLIADALPLNASTQTGIVLCAICAAGPMSLKASQISRSDMAWALSLSVTLLLLNLATVPLWSRLLLDLSVSLPSADIIGVLALSILGPVTLGVYLGRFDRDSAKRWADRLYLASNVTLAIAVVLGVAAHMGRLLGSLTSLALVAALFVIVVSGVIGWAIPDDVSRRRSTTFTTMNRATSVALLVVGRAFPEEIDVFIAIVVFGLTQTVIAVTLGLYWGRGRVDAESRRARIHPLSNQ